MKVMFSEDEGFAYNLPALSHNLVTSLINDQNKDIIVTVTDFLFVDSLVGRGIVTNYKDDNPGTKKKAVEVYVKPLSLNKYAKLILMYGEVAMTCRWFIDSTGLLKDWETAGKPKNWSFFIGEKPLLLQPYVSYQTIIDIPPQLWDIMFS